MKKNIKNIFGAVTGNKNNNETNEERYNSQCPIVKINDIDLVVTLGQWMGILPDSVKTGGNGMFVITQLSAEELLKRKGVSKSSLSAIVKKVSYLLHKVGFGADNTCILDSFDEEKLSFNCSFSETGEVANMKIRFGSFLDEGPSLTIEYDKIISRYDYWHETKERPDRLNLEYVVKEVDSTTNKKFYHYVSEYRYCGSVYDDNNKVEVEVAYPKSLENGNMDNPYVNKELLEAIISSFTFPVDIEDLVSRITAGFKVGSNEFPEISIIVKKIDKDKKETVTDQALFKMGEFVKLTITKNEKRISINNFDQWSYSTDKSYVNQTSTDNENVSIDCGYKYIPAHEVEQLETPQVLVSQAREDVKEVKMLAKRMLQKK